MNLLNPAQVLLLSLDLMGLGLVFARYRQKRIGAPAALLWLLLWIGAAVLILFPNSTIAVAHRLGIGRGVDLVLYVSVLFILYLLFRIYVRLEQLDREITQIVRALALREEREAPHGAGTHGDRSDSRT